MFFSRYQRSICIISRIIPAHYEGIDLVIIIVITKVKFPYGKVKYENGKEIQFISKSFVWKISNSERIVPLCHHRTAWHRVNVVWVIYNFTVIKFHNLFLNENMNLPHFLRQVYGLTKVEWFCSSRTNFIHFHNTILDNLLLYTKSGQHWYGYVSGQSRKSIIHTKDIKQLLSDYRNFREILFLRCLFVAEFW